MARISICDRGSIGIDVC